MHLSLMHLSFDMISTPMMQQQLLFTLSVKAALMKCCWFCRDSEDAGAAVQLVGHVQ